MSLGGFAGKLFEVSQNKIYTFYEDTNDMTVNTEEQEVDGEKPSTYIKGLGLEGVSLNIKLKQSSSIDVDTEVAEWKAICATMSPCYLWLGNKSVTNNRFLLTDINFSDKIYTYWGKLVQVTMKLTFKEYVRDGVEKEEGTTSSAKESAITTSAKSTSTTSATSTMSSSDEEKITQLESEVFGG
jgi:hypothetical protein